MADSPSSSGLLTPKVPVGQPGKLPSPDDVLNFLNEGEEAPPIEEEEEKPEPRKRGVEKTDEEEKPEGEPKEDDELELVEPDEESESLKLEEEEPQIDAPPRKKAILKEFPEIFKKFPFLEKVLYRDREYTELFGSLDDAKELAGKAEVFNDFEQQLLSGDTKEILKNVKESDPRAFDKIVDNYLGALHSVDKDAYYDVINNINKRVIMQMYTEGQESSNESLKEAAVILNQWLGFGNKFTAPTQRVKSSETSEKSEVENERRAFVQERFETSRDELQGRVDNTLRATINEYIDPTGRMPPYVKKNAITDALKMVHDTINNDRGSRSTIDKLWKGAFDQKFSRDSLGRIQSFYLGRAKSVLGQAIKRARSEALKDLPPRQRKEREEPEEETPRRRTTVVSGKETRQPEKKGGIRKGESVADFFARD